MASGWRNRYLAPVYALVISFVIVLLAAFTLGKSPSSTLPNSTPTKIHFVIDRTNVPATKLKDTSVEVFGGDPQKANIDDKGEVSLPVPNGRFMICAALPRGWSAPGKPSNSPNTCWGPFAERDVVVHVRAAG